MPALTQRVRRIRKSFYWRLSVTFLILIVLAGGTGLGLSVLYWKRSIDYGMQYLHRDLASDYKRLLLPYVNEPINALTLFGEIEKLRLLNPSTDIYLLDRDGGILWGSRNPTEHVTINMESVKRFLTVHEDLLTPIYGTDPSSHRAREGAAVFSAAPMKFGATEAYIYIVLQGSRLTDVFGNVLSYNLQVFSILWVGAVTACIAILGLVIFYFLTRRFSQMTTMVEQFSQGEYGVRVPIGRDDEVGMLGNAFNTMADTIQRHVETISENDQQRRELVANVSHDLRGPLTSICGYLEIVETKHASELKEDVRECLDVIGSNVEALRHLAASLFELSLLEAKDTAPALESFALDELSDEVLGRFRIRAQGQSVTVQLEAPTERLRVVADPQLIDRVLSNLIDNALRYTPAGGSVTVRLIPSETSLLVQVADTGSGIPAEHLPHLFDRFYRVEGHRSKQSGGSGLGLAIVRRIIDAHGFSISVESEFGKGTTFSFSLPLTPC